MSGMTAAQLVASACQIAKTPGMVAQAGQMLNMILAELCQDYDFEVARRKTYFNLNPGVKALVGNSIYGSGPYDLPTGFLRIAGPDNGAAFYTIDGVPRPLIGCDLTEFDMMVQQAGNQSYPCILAVDMSPLDAAQQGDATPSPQAYVWPAPSGAYPVTLSYFCQMDDIATPETSAVVPWFPNQAYLKTRLAGEMMQFSDDDRAAAFLATTPGNASLGAGDLLARYLKNKDNTSNRSRSVTLDRRRFGRGGGRLPNTKTMGW